MKIRFTQTLEVLCGDSFMVATQRTTSHEVDAKDLEALRATYQKQAGRFMGQFENEEGEK